jgi:hypothetical protein
LSAAKRGEEGKEGKVRTKQKEEKKEEEKKRKTPRKKKNREKKSEVDYKEQRFSMLKEQGRSNTSRLS